MLWSISYLAIYAILFTGLAVPLYILVQSVIDFRGTPKVRGDVVLKALTCLAAWVIVSFCLFYMMFLTVYGSAHTVDRQAAQTGIARNIILLSLLYAVVGGVLVYWTRRKPRADLDITIHGQPNNSFNASGD